MPDFFNRGWSWYIASITLLSLVGLFLLVWRLSSRRGTPSQTTETSGHVWDKDLAEYNNPLPRWWLNLFYITLVWGGFYLFAYPGLGAFSGYLQWTQQDQYNAEIASANQQYGPLFDRYLHVDLTNLSRDPAAIKVGAHLFSAYCASCHGADARGARHFPNLRDNDWLYGGTPEAIEASITNGRQGMMPAWGAILGEEAVKNLTAYVESLSGRQIDHDSTQRGAALFATNCVACHGADAKGNPVLGAPNLTDDIWLHGGTTEQITQTIRNGRNGQMPAHGPLLGKAKVHLLAAYVLSLRNASTPTHVED